MADINSPTQSLPHARILVDGSPTTTDSASVDAAGFAVSVNANGELQVDYVSGGDAVLTVSDPSTGASGTDALSSPIPGLVVTLEAPTA